MTQFLNKTMTFSMGGADREDFGKRWGETFGSRDTVLAGAVACAACANASDDGSYAHAVAGSCSCACHRAPEDP